ncbi:NADP-dependent 3-hydroxy acid dehydrogenase YdfG [Jatrophihabitans sp. GAS493]|uniref:SDR family oxidoreductase n=1 Tax=Jatrophihabitans sp. GAS493 TaxID=1907575 RepID=UPI000BB75050|nr:SDR family oxidoreductase [Jatrophihabitans sp. GAS493]SOD74186.1 NADP-dependent 3-hydroxy acid dehydrogenase YdfG [Jatrophihabitans sp. GAS493]
MGRYVITGATRGIGRALVELLSPAHDIIAVGRDEAALKELPVAERILLDLSRPASFAAVVDACPYLGHLDGLVHSAGIAQRASLANSSPELWEQHFTLNVTAVAELTRVLLPGLRAGRGSVVLINSGQGLNASADSAVYAASKFGLRGLADSLRAEEPALRVSTVYPGRVATEMQRELRAQEAGEYEPQKYIQPATLAVMIAQILATPSDSVVTELVVRPRG